MSLVTMDKLLKDARGRKQAVGGFNVSSIEMILGVIHAAEKWKTPVILQVAEGRLATSPLYILGPAMLAAAKAANVEVAVHLDHGQTFGCIQQALDIGFTSVMFDGSKLSLQENIEQTRKVLDMARPYGASVEAEIGSVGRSETGEDSAAVCASPEDGIAFLKEAPVSALAVAIGNAHGVYVGDPVLHFDVLEELQKHTDTPFVLHGGTGISPADFRKAITLGMNKINIATASFLASANAAQGHANDYFGMSRAMADAVQEVVEEHMQIFGIMPQA